MSTTKNLWGELPLAEVIRTPATILREQATLLTEMTKGILEGEITSGRTQNKLYHRLSIVAPSLDGYSYSILYATHNIITYPCTVLDEADNTIAECDNEQEFISVIEKILSSATVHKIVSALLSQSKAELPLDL